VEEVPATKQSAFEVNKPFREYIPLEILLVVDEHLVGLWHNPDLPMSVSNILARV
jgi:hypothetical protein